MDNISIEYPGFNYVLAMLVDRKSGDIARQVGIMVIQIEDRESEHASAELKIVALGWGYFLNLHSQKKISNISRFWIVHDQACIAKLWIIDRRHHPWTMPLSQ